MMPGRDELHVRHAVDAAVPPGRPASRARSPAPPGRAAARGSCRRCVPRKVRRDQQQVVVQHAQRRVRAAVPGARRRARSQRRGRAISPPASGRSAAGRRPRGCCGAPATTAAARRAGARPRRRLAVVDVEQQPVRQHLDPFGEPLDGAACGLRSSSSKRSSSTSRVDQCSISERGLPSAAIRPPSMTTSRSQSCSASSM